MAAIPSNDALIFSPRAGVRGRGVPLVRALLAQVVAGIVVAASLHFAGQPPLHPLLIQGLVAGVVGQALRAVARGRGRYRL